MAIMRRRHLGLRWLAAVFAAVTITAVVAAPVARAEEEEPSFNFKLPDKSKPVPEMGSDGKPTAPAPDVEEQSNVVPTMVRLEIEYPKLQGYIGFDPGYIGLNQVGNSSGLNFNVAQYTPIAFAVGGKAEFTPRISLEANLGYSQFSTPAQALPLAAIIASTANMVTGNVDGFYCFIIGVTGLKVCPGLGIGVDGFPVFQFTDNTTVQINSFADMIVRGAGKLEYPIGANTAVWLTANYDLGFLKGATGGIATTSHHALGGILGFNTPLTMKTDLLLAVSLNSMSSSFTQNGDTWSSTGTLVSLTGGISYRF